MVQSLLMVEQALPEIVPSLIMRQEVVVREAVSGLRLKPLLVQQPLRLMEEMEDVLRELPILPVVEEPEAELPFIIITITSPELNLFPEVQVME